MPLAGVTDSFKTGTVPGVRMGTMTSSDADIAAAGQFLAASGRVLDQRRFQRLFTGGRAEYVRDAVAAYRNPDGGFGHALEPDGRGPGSQPLATEFALETLDEADAWDDGLVRGALDWLEASAPREGGAVFVADKYCRMAARALVGAGRRRPGVPHHHRAAGRHAARSRSAASLAGPGHRSAVGADR